ncbi:MAG: helix-turn-helix transcriptional regulator, partial [Anaerobutyricum hallii]|uniref:helix-turn-helix transcriptional regulator n=1 Tax=Anaerobutyricum hallii TaxID=39488 RepID=UPI002A81A871
MTLKDIAKEAGVSMMTVSNVINKKYDRVSQKTIDKVQAVIEKYHYVPNLTARSLTARSSHIIGCILTNQTGN